MQIQLAKQGKNISRGGGDRDRRRAAVRLGRFPEEIGGRKKRFWGFKDRHKWGNS